jgi:hypothetical protein
MTSELMVDNHTETRGFKVDREIIWSLVFKQNTCIVGAIVELIQNSFDANATEANLKITEEGFSISDNGDGFSSRQQIEDWFETFGSSGKDVDETRFGRFRMGRGQIMGHTSTMWRSGVFEMRVDVKTHGLNYSLITHEESVKGCTVEGDWYEGLETHHRYDKVSNVEWLSQEIAKKCKYLYGMKITVNNEYINNFEKIQFDYEDDDCIFISTKRDFYWGHINIYNLGLFVESTDIKNLHGVLITKKHLKLNISRSQIQSNCELMHRIRQSLCDFAPKYCQKNYSPREAKEIINSYLRGDDSLKDIENLSLFKDLYSRHYYTIKDLSKKNFTIASCDTRLKTLADIAYQQKACIVLHNDFSKYKWGDTFPIILLKHLNTYTSSHSKESLQRIMKLNKRFLEEDDAYSLLDLDHFEIPPHTHTRKMKAQLRALNFAAQDIYRQLGVVSFKKPDAHSGRVRGFLVGASSRALAWTDGVGYIVIEKQLLTEMEKGAKGIIRMLLIIAHEYAHTKSNLTHDAFFYERFHNLVIDANLAWLIKIVLKEYRKALKYYELKIPKLVENERI